MQLREMGAGAITLGERSGMGDTRTVMRQLGAFDLAEELGFGTVVFDELAAEDWTVIRSEGDHWQRGFAVPRLLLDAEAVVQICNLKTHRYGGHFTLSLKNSVGFAAKQIARTGYNYMTELHNSPDQRTMIAEINRTYAPALVVMDGVEAFTSGGPDRGALVRPEVILAGRDRIALDAVGVAILRHYGTTPEVSKGARLRASADRACRGAGAGRARPPGRAHPDGRCCRRGVRGGDPAFDHVRPRLAVTARNKQSSGLFYSSQYRSMRRPITARLSSQNLRWRMSMPKRAARSAALPSPVDANRLT